MIFPTDPCSDFFSDVGLKSDPIFRGNKRFIIDHIIFIVGWVEFGQRRSGCSQSDEGKIDPAGFPEVKAGSVCKVDSHRVPKSADPPFGVRTGIGIIVFICRQEL